MGQEAPPPFNSEQLVKAVRHFFKLYVRDNQIAPDDITKLNPGHFVQWLRTSDNPQGMPGLHPYTDHSNDIARYLGVPVEAVEFVIRLGVSSTGLAHLSNLWPHLVLENRHTQHEIRSFQLMFIAQWVDDVICPLTRLVHVETNPDKLKDAEAVQFISSQGSMFAHQILQTSLDALHDGHEAYKGLGHPDTLAKIMLSCEDAQKAGRISADDLSDISRNIQYMGTLFPRTLPEQVKKKFAAQQAGQDQPKEAQGGWDANQQQES